MTQPEIEIRRAWRHIAGHHHDGCVDGLLIRYGEPSRHYHTATHIMWVLRHLHDLASASVRELSSELIAAALYHDAIYDSRAADNEARSAALAARELSEIGWSAEQCAAVEALIITTAGHVAAEASPLAGRDNDDEANMLLDADLAILGSEPGAYSAYVHGIRSEYIHVDDDAWRSGRARILQQFLDRPRLFATEYMYTAREHRARANIAAELAGLIEAPARVID
jgi:predicted metal-dependent HD superfamily phosphohydrolase